MPSHSDVTPTPPPSYSHSRTPPLLTHPFNQPTHQRRSLLRLLATARPQHIQHALDVSCVAPSAQLLSIRFYSYLFSSPFNPPSFAFVAASLGTPANLVSKPSALDKELAPSLPKRKIAQTGSFTRSPLGASDLNRLALRGKPPPPCCAPTIPKVRGKARVS